jgi:nucleotide-binding universal stress UspA family protein
MKRILLLTDFSEAAHNAIDYAQKLWANFDCEFHLLHVVISGSYTTESLLSSGTNEDIYSSLLKSTKEEMVKTLKQISEANTNPKHHFKSHLDHDLFIDAIDQVVLKEHIDVVVLGSNGASDVKEVLFGSHSLKVMRQLPHNVLVIPDEYEFIPVNRLLLVLDDQDQLNDSLISRLHELKNNLNADLHILGVNLSSDSNDAMIEKEFGRDVSYKKVEGVPLEYAASTYLQTKDISFIILIGEMAGFIDRLRGRQGKTKLSKLYTSPLFLIRD